MDSKTCLLVATHVAALAIGISFGFWNWAPKTVHEEAAPAIILPATASSPHGAVIAERKIDSSAKPKQSVPSGFKPERLIGVDIAPSVQPMASNPASPCPKTHVDATVVRDADGAGRVIVSSPDGVITNATDTVISSITTSPRYLWAAGPAYSSKRGAGIWANRDFGRIRAGLMATQSQPDGYGKRDYEAWVLVGFNFGG